MAASRLKGITIPINGDVTPLSKALKDVNSTIKSTTGYLKEIDAGLKLDPSNVDLLTKKQGALNDAIAATKDKLQTMQDAAQAAHEALDRGEISAEQYRDLQAEIQATENSLASLQAEADDTSSALLDIGSGAMDAASDVSELGGSASGMGSEFDLSGAVAGDAMMKVGSEITGVGDKLMDVTNKVKELGTAAVDSFLKLDEGMDTILKKTGASGEELEEMETIAKKLYGSMTSDMNDIGAAVGAVSTRFGVEGDELEQLSQRFLRFAELNGTDVSSSVEQVQKLLSAFGMEGKQAGAVLDLLNQTGQETGINVMTLAQNLQSQATALQEMGLDAAQAAQFLGQVEMSGADVSTVMSSLRTAVKNTSKDGEDLSETLTKFSHYLQTGASDTAKLNKAMELFGSKGGAQMMNAIKDGQITFDNFDQSLTSVAGSVDKTYNAMHDGGDDYTIALHNMELAGAEVGESLLNDLVPVMEAVTVLLKDFSEWWNSNSETTNRIIEVIALVVAAIGPLLVALGSLVTWIGSVISTVTAIWPWLTATAIPFITETVVPAVISVGSTIGQLIPPITAAIAVITAIILWIKNFDDILEVAKMFLFDFKDSFMLLSDWIGESGAFFLDPIFEVLANFQIMIEDMISKALGWGKDLIGNLVSGVKSKLTDVKNAAGSVGQNIKDFLHFSKPDKGPLADIDTWMPDMMGLLSRGIEDNLGTIQSAAGSAAGAIATAGGRDYSGQLSSIQSTLAGAGAPSVTVYIGQEQMDALVYDAITRNNYLGGGN